MDDGLFPENLMHIRWFASKCTRFNIKKASYAGWDVYTQPVSFDEAPTGGRVFSTSDIYVESMDNWREVISESRVFVNGKIAPRHKDVRIIAPYVSFRGLISIPLTKVWARRYVSYFMLQGISKPNEHDFDVTYISEINPAYSLPGSGIYGGPKFSIKRSESVASETGGFNQYHKIALGIMKRTEVERLCNGELVHSKRIEMSKCLHTPPNPQMHQYGSDMVRLSYGDLFFLLKNKNVHEICTSIRRPFMYFYPGLDYSACPPFIEIAESTLKAVQKLKSENYPDCKC